MHGCSTSHALAASLHQRAARLTQAGGRGQAARSLSGYVGPLPPLGAPGGTTLLTQAHVEAFGGLYYYGELETTGLLSVAELIVEERYTLNLMDRDLFLAMEEIADAMVRGWYDDERRAQIFAAALGLETSNDFRRVLVALVDALDRYDRETRYGGTSFYGPVAAVEFAMGAVLDEIARRAGLGLERAAEVLNDQLRKAIAILGNASLQRLFNVRDMWDLIGAIVADANGRVPPFQAIADRAEAGAALLGWIASRIAEIRARDGSVGALLRHDAGLFRNASRWRMAMGGTTGMPPSAGTSPGYGAWPSPAPPPGQSPWETVGAAPSPYAGNPGGFAGGWA